MSFTVDVHHHILPDVFWRATNDAHSPVGGILPAPWSKESTLSYMDDAEIDVAITYISTPGVHMGDDSAARDLARRVNELSAELIHERPDRFGGFAALPLPDVDGALHALEYGLDVLKLDGVVLFSNARGIHLGDARFRPLFDELERRGAVVFVHPTSSPDPAARRLGLPDSLIDFTADTTRAVAQLHYGNTFARTPNVKYIPLLANMPSAEPPPSRPNDKGCVSRNLHYAKAMDEPARYRWIAAHILPHEAELRGWLRRRLGALSSNDIDDLVQEGFARIWEADFSTIRNGRAYLYATVRHLLAEYARRSRIVPIELLGEIDSLNLISDEPGPDRLVGARQELARLRAIVALLPIQCRRVFEFRKFEDLSQRDIAQRMGLSEKTVENHLTRALARIGEMLAASVPAAESAHSESLAQLAEDTDRGHD